MHDWANSKATLVINEDPAAGDIDDMDVAIWAVDALQGCEKQTGQANLMSEGRFSLHMAHWRDHIHSVAQVVRQRFGRTETKGAEPQVGRNRRQPSGADLPVSEEAQDALLLARCAVAAAPQLTIRRTAAPFRAAYNALQAAQAARSAANKGA